MCIPAADVRISEINPRILLVGACPGRDEEIQGRPFAGQAGQNLNVMLQRLHTLHPDIFPSGRADDYSMLNAHSLPRYRARDGFDGRTQPLKREVLAQDNRDRLIAHLQRIRPEIVVYLGKAANFAHGVVRVQGQDILTYRAGHPSTQAWNTKREYAGMLQQEKLTRWAEDKFNRVP
ncbi:MULTISPECIES: uracil-DNA glycosylase family protein [Roseobacteraceae]|jgi:uracil-DNA glycosylase|uniref:uracil-DNA glycosylase family protein n=1 Tax=Roseobacteraceae TaxID=2854170 RepID=UPI00326364DC